MQGKRPSRPLISPHPILKGIVLDSKHHSRPFFSTACMEMSVFASVLLVDDTTQVKFCTLFLSLTSASRGEGELFSSHSQVSLKPGTLQTPHVHT